MASHDDVGIGDFVLLDEITVERAVDNLKTRYADRRSCLRARFSKFDGIERGRADKWRSGGERPARTHASPRG